MSCRHEHLKFSVGATFISCVDCSVRWCQMDKDGKQTMSEFGNVTCMPPYDTRHSPYVAARRDPLKKKAK